jgi:hypothetical protein
MVVPVVYESIASFAQVGACAFYEKIALCRACLVGKCLQSSASLMLVALLFMAEGWGWLMSLTRRCPCPIHGEQVVTHHELAWCAPRRQGEMDC